MEQLIFAVLAFLFYILPVYYLSQLAVQAKRQTALLEQLVKRP